MSKVNRSPRTKHPLTFTAIVLHGCRRRVKTEHLAPVENDIAVAPASFRQTLGPKTGPGEGGVNVHNDLPIGRWLLLVGSIAAGVAVAVAPDAAADSYRQAWPAFALVAGLIAIGHAANAEGMFTTAGERAARARGGPTILFVILMLLVCVVTVVLNLDTSVTFLTPVLTRPPASTSMSLAFSTGPCSCRTQLPCCCPGRT